MIWKKILFIFNPVAGRSQIRNYLLDIIETLSAAEFKVVCYPTKGRGDARRLARERLDDYLYIACAGGDGTLDEVVSGMMENPNKPFVPIGYIPAGTTNDFASSLGIPSDMRMAAEIIAQGKTFRCDLGLFNAHMSLHSGFSQGHLMRHPRNSRISWGTLPTFFRVLLNWGRSEPTICM